MNTLSLLIYAADVAGNIGALLIALAVFGSSAITFFTICGVIFRSEGEVEKGKYLHRMAIKLCPFLAAVLVLSIFLPTQTTIYAIAASEMGEDVLDSETGGKAVEALNEWLDRQIEGEK